MIYEKPFLLKTAALRNLVNAEAHGKDKPGNNDLVAANQKNRNPRVENGIGILPINGVLINADAFEAWWFGGIAYQEIRIVLESFEKSDDVKSIILDINSPGGDAFGTSEVADYLHGLSKPTTTYVSGECCSAAFWLACATDKIVMHKTALVGSIGTCIAFATESKVDFIVSDQSPLKIPDLNTDEGASQVRQHLNTITDSFIKDIAGFRKSTGITPELVAANWGRGDVVGAESALQNRMVDIVGTFEAAVKISRLMGGAIVPVVRQQVIKQVT